MIAADKKEQRFYSYQLVPDVRQDRLHSGFLVLREVPTELISPPKYGLRLAIPGAHIRRDDLIAAADEMFTRFNKSEVSSESVPKLREKLRGYRLLGTARFQVVDLKWEPILEIKNLEGPNRGQKQTVAGAQTPFPRNLYRSPDLAAQFALDYGKQMVVGTINGLEI